MTTRSAARCARSTWRCAPAPGPRSTPLSWRCSRDDPEGRAVRHRDDLHPSQRTGDERGTRRRRRTRRRREDRRSRARHRRRGPPPRFPAGTEPAGEGRRGLGELLGVGAETGRRAWRRCTDRTDLYRDLDPDAVAVLREICGRGLAVAAVSNSDGTLTEELARFGLLDFFDVVADSTLTGVEKPEPGIFASALGRLGCAPADALFVGDGLINDIFGALRAGIASTVLYDRHQVYRELPVPVITALPQLLDHLPAA
ncbi:MULTISPECIES: HAD family hydrolase [unclassified Streptomyces]|uniref:HAD family hydrolase n=1 Tax=unclassified Streptomyces TaxID=2593676 RepID=UPI000DABCB05|nr:MULTISPECIES: HAD-IA family hydrolase [unclassified Streptomyces]PZT75873.1 hypothetical protein DNK56_20915 [Streptomyces sp. AC1-42W]PZT80175.1 hypothetical protein DNK55_11770 [Streptomyces sp. AC1-42T]